MSHIKIAGYMYMYGDVCPEKFKSAPEGKCHCCPLV